MATEILALLTAGWTGLTTALLLGTLLGFIVGLVPGLGGRVGIILCIPLATFWDSLGGAVFLFAMHAVVHTSASIPAIAFALPSSGADAATIVDGYPLAKMGRAGEALGASLSASALGGVLGAVAFLACIPIARLLIVWFGPPEFLLLAIAGLTMVVFLSGKSILAGLLVGLLGFLAASVGLDVMTSSSRFTFGRPELMSGLNLAAVLGGILVVPEMLARWSFDDAGHQRAVSTSLDDVLHGMRTTFSHLGLVLRSSFYGIVVGIMPGVGSSVSVWMSYAFAARTVKSEIPFGQGAIAGVIAPEAANNSKEGGAMVPTLFFGIPGSSSMAIMLSALVVIGQPIGPSLLSRDLQVPMALAATVCLANLIAVPMFLAVVPGIVRLAALRREHMVPFAIALSLLAALYQSLNWVALVTFAAAGLVGCVLRWAGWPRVPFILGFVMGPLAEISYIQTSQIWGWTMFARPATIAMIAVFLVIAFRARRSKSDTRSEPLDRTDALVSLPLLLVFAVALGFALRFPINASPVPQLVSLGGLVLAGLVLTIGLRRGQPKSPDRLQKFDSLCETGAYLLMVPLLGLPIASTAYAGVLMVRARAGYLQVALSTLGLGLLQIWLLSIAVDIRGEPIVRGWLLSLLF
ncbi:MAG: tripartite tricarboxylate transporter permease [Alphaproteobacteria bacterium]|nr:tripartite tricarboxylate transporter permease [Alphaproteobacteria bacterium]MBU0802654.1 tripartite tricarboxylate transporter permease [Alphaproteobacteria bacterium]MBU0871451.1 tripartite tricarboxylate transporter permease [Alphaproteobacteria bacterium]MBU1400118.1 tripartite tricarboxylate transporter permease [Alphaproteobacteria bacterium]MBU1591238.1 tripartite tricarboxylate transporter permease [Alphaproteobacteria bacterium]